MEHKTTEWMRMHVNLFQSDEKRLWRTIVSTTVRRLKEFRSIALGASKWQRHSYRAQFSAQVECIYVFSPSAPPYHCVYYWLYSKQQKKPHGTCFRTTLLTLRSSAFSDNMCHVTSRTPNGDRCKAVRRGHHLLAGDTVWRRGRQRYRDARRRDAACLFQKSTKIDDGLLHDST